MTIRELFGDWVAETEKKNDLTETNPKTNVFS